ncbi:MAG: dolichyl-phosphate beta-glucosyltransferase [Chloroflexota bacterium]
MFKSDERPFLSVIVPAYNEEKRIAKTLNAIYKYLALKTFSWELLIVIDGATDNTIGQVLDFAKDKEGEIRWIDRKENRGKGYTVREGMLAANGSYCLFTDADNSTDISHFDQMELLIRSGKDIVICSRDSKDVAGACQAIPQPFHKRLLGNIGNLIIQFIAVPGIWDTQCGFKLFSREAALKIFPLIQNERWMFDVEVLALARRYDYSIGIVPAYWIDDPRTNVHSLLDYVDSLLQTFKIRWHMMTGLYERLPSVSVNMPTLVDE